MALTRPRAAQIYDIDYKQATRVVTVANITLSGGAPSSVDGVSLSLNDRVLVTGQSTASQNGVYYVTTLGSGSNGTWSRSLDTNNTGEILSGTIVMVTEGTIYADTQWKLITDGVINVGVTPQVWTQNYSANSISGGTSNVTVLTNANVTISSAGTANVLVVSSTGTIVTGTESVTGNATVGNLLTAGLISATGNVTGNYFIGNVFYANGITASKIYSGTSEVNVTSSGGNVNVSIGGTSNVAVWSTTGEYVTGLISASGNVTGGNVLFGSGVISGTGNATAGNVLTGGLISATGNVNGGNLGTAGTALISGAMSVSGSTVLYSSSTNNDTIGPNKTTGAITIGSAAGTGTIQLGQSTANQTVNIATGILPGGITKTINIGTGGTSTSQTNITIGTQTAPTTTTFQSSTTVAIANTSGSALSVAGNITGANILTGGLVSATANITAGNVLTGGLISATGNVAGNYFLGNVACASGIFSTKIFSGTTEANIVSANGNLAISVGGTSNVAVFATTGEYVTGLVSASGNVTGGNLITGGLISATANVTGGNILTAGLISATGNVTGSYLKGNASQVTGISTFNQIFVTGATTVNATSLTSNVTFTAGSNIALTSDGNTITIAYSASGSSSIFATGGDMGLIANPVTTSEDLGNVTTVADTSYDLGTLFTTTTLNQLDMTGFTANVNTGNLNAVGLVSAAGNITGNYILGNGSQLTSLPGGISLTNGTSNIVVGSSANITLAVAGTSNVVVWANTGQYVTGIISATGNIITGTNGYIGIGTSAPDAELTILGNPQTVTYTLVGNSTTSGTELHISGADAANTRITQDAFGTGSYVAFTGRAARGTAATPTQTQSGDTIAQFTGRGFSNGSLQFGNVSTGRLDVVAAENFTDTSRATNVQIFTTATSSITPAAVATFSSASGLSVAGNITSTGNIGGVTSTALAALNINLQQNYGGF